MMVGYINLVFAVFLKIHSSKIGPLVENKLLIKLNHFND